MYCSKRVGYFRVEYDAYRSDMELLVQASRTDANAARLDEAQLAFQQHRDNFEKLKGDVAIKMKFLDENRVRFAQSHSFTSGLLFR